MRINSTSMSKTFFVILFCNVTERSALKADVYLQPNSNSVFSNRCLDTIRFRLIESVYYYIYSLFYYIFNFDFWLKSKVFMNRKWQSFSIIKSKRYERIEMFILRKQLFNEMKFLNKNHYMHSKLQSCDNSYNVQSFLHFLLFSLQPNNIFIWCGLSFIHFKTKFHIWAKIFFDVFFALSHIEKCL